MSPLSGNCTLLGTKGGYLAGVVGENWKGIVEKAYVDAEITGNKAKAAGLVYSSQNGGNNHTVGKEGVLRNQLLKVQLNSKKRFNLVDYWGPTGPWGLLKTTSP